jgi:ribosomal protein S18 acetylase RimI-like enzyme
LSRPHAVRGVQTILNLRRRIVADLHAAFAEDPVLCWVFPDPVRRRRWGSAYFDIHARRSMRAGTSWHTDGGAALWDAPNRWRLSTAESLSLALRSAPGIGRRGGLVGEGLMEVEHAHPAEPHWYLAVLGVRPDRRGLGAGSALLEPGLARADAAGMPCYLESSNPRNVGLYERHGFEVVAEHWLPDGPLFTYMWRRPG